MTGQRDLPLFSRTPEAHDPGGKSRLRMLPGVRGAAQFSPCCRYRYWLSRKWGADDAPFALWIGMNPSTAEADFDDPTIRKEIFFTKREGYTSLVKVNVADLRATDPSMLHRYDGLVRSDENLVHIRRFAADAAIIVLAFGSLAVTLRGYGHATVTALKHRQLWCLGTTKDGSPKHPLYLSGDTALVRWEISELRAWP